VLLPRTRDQGLHDSLSRSSAFAGYRFPPEVITLAVRWFLRFGLSYRDVEELLAERGTEVDHVTIYRWVQRFAPEFAEAARARQHLVGDRWHVDETYLKVGGTWRCLFRAIDQFGQVIDVFLSPRRNREAASRLFVQAISRSRQIVDVVKDVQQLERTGLSQGNHRLKEVSVRVAGTSGHGDDSKCLLLVDEVDQLPSFPAALHEEFGSET